MTLQRKITGMLLLFGVCLLLNGCRSSVDNHLHTEVSVIQEPVTEINIVTDVQAGTEITKDDIPLNEEITIKENCTQIANNTLNDVFNELKQQLSDVHAGIYNYENFKMKVVSEKIQEDGSGWTQVTLSYDRIPVRGVEDDPFIIGMQEARDGLTDEKKIAAADEIIEGWRREKEGNIQELKDEPRCSDIDWYIAFSPDKDSYTIYHKGVYGNKDEMVELKDYIQKFCKEDAEDKKAQGQARLLESLE